MESVDEPEPCIVEETTLILDSSGAARRKRMEIRRVQQSASKSAQQKRSRPLSAGLGNEDDNFSSPKANIDGDVPLASHYLAEMKGKDVFGHAYFSSDNLRRAGGLVRSKSFPLEEWQRSASKCFLKISKTSRCRSITGVEGRLVTVLTDEHGNTLNDAQASFRATWTAKVASSSPPSASAVPVEVEGEKEELQNLREKGEEVQKIIEIPSLVSDNSLKPIPEASSGGEAGLDYKAEAVSTAPEGPLQCSPSYSPATELEMVDPAGKAASCTVVNEVVPNFNDNCASLSRCLSDGKCPPSGKLLVCGRRREMEDTATIVPSFAALPCGVMGGCYSGGEPKMILSDLHFFGVYDGHGGSQASNFCRERFHQALGEELKDSSLVVGYPKVDPTDGWGCKWEKVMAACFSKMDKEVGGVCPNGECDDVDSTTTCCVDTIAPENVGTTAVVAVVGSCQIVVANCGDSRAVLSRGGKAIPLSMDHKPERDDETKRIEAAGGRVIYWDGYRVGGLLAVSRSIGDRFLKRYVVSEPEVMCLQRTEEDECLILASDGLWNVISNDLACEVARKRLATARKKRESALSPPGEDPATTSAAGLLVKLAYGKGSKDNIGVVVVDLKALRS